MVSHLRILMDVPSPGKSGMSRFRLSRTLLHDPMSKPIYVKGIASFDQLLSSYE